MTDQRHDLEEARAAVDQILARPRSPDYGKLRQQAAYIFCTGVLFTHARPPTNAKVLAIIDWGDTPAGLDLKSGSARIRPYYATKLELEGHPMVMKGRELVRQGWKIDFSGDRRNPLQLHLKRGSEVCTVHADGATLIASAEVAGVLPCVANRRAA